MNNATVEKILKEIESYSPKGEGVHVGRVVVVGDGVVAIDGLSKAVMAEVLEFEETKGKKLKESIEHEGKLLGLVPVSYTHLTLPTKRIG